MQQDKKDLQRQKTCNKTNHIKEKTRQKRRQDEKYATRG